MSKFRKQDTSEETSWAILYNSYNPEFFLINNWFIKDRYPDVDGQIRLRNPNGLYLNKYLHCQTKGVEKLDPTDYLLKREYIDYLIDTNIPTIFFVVDITIGKVYWFYLDRSTISRLHLSSDGKGRKIDLSKNEFTKVNSSEVNALWQKFAKTDNYKELNDSVNEIVAEFHKNVRNCVGLLYLLRRVERDQINTLFAQLLKISEDDAKTIINKLDEKGVLSKTSNLYLVENEQLGIDCLFDLIETNDVNTLTSSFKELSDVKAISKQLAKVKHPKVDAYLENFFKEILAVVKKSKSNDEIKAHLEILEGIAFRDSKTTMEIVNAIVTSKTEYPPTIHRSKFGKYSGKSHLDLILECLEILEDLRYLETKRVFMSLLRLPRDIQTSRKGRYDEVVKNLAEYNLEALKIIGYSQQLTLVSELEKLDKKQLIDNDNFVLKIAGRLLSPSFEGRSMSDYRTLVWSSGGLNVTTYLKDIRDRTIGLLFKMFGIFPEEKQKVAVLQTLSEATDAPMQGNYSDELNNLIKDNSEELIKFYLKTFNFSGKLVAQEIEEQVSSLIMRHGSKGLPSLRNLEEKIASDGEYDLFRVFVGYDAKLSKDRDWQKVTDERKKKIQEYVDTIDFKNYREWVGKIKEIVKNYEDVDPGKYQYFFNFLYLLGKDKPEIVTKLINENEKLMDKFIYHPLLGLWESNRKELGKKRVEDWLKENKHITTCTVLLANLSDYQKDLLEKVVAIAIKSRNVLALNNCINACSKHHKLDRHLKGVFIKCIATLSKLKDTSWINGLWFRDKTVLGELDLKNVNLVLDNLIHAQSVDYHVEEILIEFANKFPKEIINYFRKRLDVKKSENNRYDKLPYRLHQLDVELRKNASKIVPLLLRWFDSSDAVIKFSASHFFQTIFPSFGDELEKAFIDVIKKRNRRELINVLLILESYDGEVFVHKTVQEVIKNFTLDKEIKSSLFVILSNTGVVSGEYGMAEAYKRKKDEIQKWKVSKDKRIQDYAKEYEKSLDELIEAETKRADDMILLMKKGLN